MSQLTEQLMGGVRQGFVCNVTCSATSKWVPSPTTSEIERQSTTTSKPSSKPLREQLNSSNSIKPGKTGRSLGDRASGGTRRLPAAHAEVNEARTELESTRDILRLTRLGKPKEDRLQAMESKKKADATTRRDQ